jgi:hypothetical protein
MDIAEFLTARLDEDEAVARTPNVARVAADNWIVATDLCGGPVIIVDPDRLLADVATKRRIVGLGPAECGAHEDEAKFNIRHYPSDGWEGYFDGCSAAESSDHTWMATLKLLTSVYRGHPDYREEWRA